MVNHIVPIFIGDQKQAMLVARACGSIAEDCRQIETAVNTSGPCVYQNTQLQQGVHSCNLTAAMLGGDIQKNAQAVNGIPATGSVRNGATIMAENNGFKTTIQNLVSMAQPIIKAAIIQ